MHYLELIYLKVDETYRDLSSVHGTYKRVQQTEKAVLLVGNLLKTNKVIWVFDKPVSNSGKLKTILRKIAEQRQFNWDIILDNNPDKILADSEHIVVSSDAWVLDRAERWLNLGAYIVEQHIHEVNSIYSL